MTIRLLIISFVLFIIQGCASLMINKDESLDIPEAGFDIVQHSREQENRKANSLYLSSRSIRADEFDTVQLDNYIKALRSTMHLYHGVGIASNQVGKNIQLFLIEAQSDAPRYQGLESVDYQVFINPRIIKASKERMNFWHGCLSARGEAMGNVATYQWIDYEGYDEHGNLNAGRLDGFAAVIFQHELRHLLGGTYLDKAEHFLEQDELYEQINQQALPFFESADDKLPLILDDYQIGESLEDYYSRN